MQAQAETRKYKWCALEINFCLLLAPLNAIWIAHLSTQSNPNALFHQLILGKAF